jgi:multiple antibiotic resistance protein
MLRKVTLGATALAIGLLGNGIAMAAEGRHIAENAAVHTHLAAVLGASQIFTLLFITLGPLKTLGPFVKATHGAATRLLAKIAVAAFAISTASLFVGMYLGQKILDKWDVSLPALILTAGALLFFVAFKTLVVDLYNKPPTSGEAETPSLRTAISPLTFPVIATPYGIAILILLKVALPERQSWIVVALGVIMVLNLIAMLFARPILRVAGMPLQLIGTILTVLQAALGVQMLILGFRSLAA